MIRAFYTPNYKQEKFASEISTVSENKAVWLDLQHPTGEEILSTEKKYNITFPTRSEQEEIETSSRYIEENGWIKINSTFLALNLSKKVIEENEISFIVTDDTLFSLRHFDSKVLFETVKKIKQNPGAFVSPMEVLIVIIETCIDLDADLIETISKSIAALSKRLNGNNALDESLVININGFQEQIMTLRESLFDKQRVVSQLLRNPKIFKDHSEILRVILKDISSLIEHTNFNFTRLEYMQNNFLGLVNIEQNKIIKLFTVASVVFMPPTLIASIYGMNFKIMPELDWMLGYPLSILLIIMSSLSTLYFFKRKKWL